MKKYTYNIEHRDPDFGPEEERLSLDEEIDLEMEVTEEKWLEERTK